MEKKQYLSDLSRVLSSRYNRKDAVSILAEYQSFFELGLKEGKTEAELCQSFGSPNEVVQFLQEEYTPPLIPNFYIVRLIGLIMFALLSSVIMYNVDDTYIIGLLMSSIWGFALWFMLGGNAHSLPPFTAVKRTSSKIMSFHGLTLFVAIASLVFHLIIVYQFNRELIPTIVILKFLLFSFIALMMIFVGIGLHGFFRVCPEYYCLICHSGGGLCSAICIYQFYANISEFKISSISLMSNYIPYIIGVVIAVVFAALIRKLREQEV